MLGFFRRYAPWFAISVVIALVVSLGAGVFMLNPKQSNSSEVRSVGAVGPIPIMEGSYSSQLQNLLRSYGIDPNAIYDPETIEAIQLSALDYAINTSVLLYEATKAGFKATHSDTEGTLASIMSQYKVNSESELKDRLTKEGVDYDQFIEGIRESVTIQLYLNKVKSAITLTEQDVLNQYMTVTYDELFVPLSPTVNGADTAKMIVAQLATQSFDTLLQKATQGQLGRAQGIVKRVVESHQLPLVLERVVFSRPLNDVSGVIESTFGWHVIRVQQRMPKPRPLTINYTVELPKVQEIKDRQAFTDVVKRAISQYGITITDPFLYPLFEKANNRLDKALMGYARVSSLAPVDPRPHYLSSLLYLQMQNQVEQEKELLRADLKGTLSPRFKLPMVDAYLGILAGKMGRIASRDAYIDASVKGSMGNYTFMKKTSKILQEGGYMSQSDQLEKEILRLETAARARQQAPVSPNSMTL